jgi:photosystem II stability/assembly factor-like uncharacterized protein
MRYLLSLFLLLAIPEDTHWWSVQTSGIDTNLRAVDIFVGDYVNDVIASIVWATGSNGVVLRSTDQGKTWQRLHVPDAEKLDFRGIQAVSLKSAYLISIGEGEKSRIYKTTDAGASWVLEYTGNRPAIFLDGISCVSENECFAISDPVDGKFLVLATTDGNHWKELPRDQMPAALTNEGIFAASNSAFLASKNESEKATELLFGTGGPAARFFRSTDSGHTWTVSETPITHANASSGIFSICRAMESIIIVGGDYKDISRDIAVAAYSTDSGRTWKLSSSQPGGFRSAVTSYDGYRIAAVGPNGTDVSQDLGVHWKHTDSLNLNAMAISRWLGTGWAAGPGGTIAMFHNRTQYLIRLDSPPKVTDKAVGTR